MKTGLYTNPIFLEHNTGQHPENANRLRAILDKLESDKLMGNFKVEAGRTATSAEIKMLHTEKLISEVETASESGAQTLHTRD